MFPSPVFLKEVHKKMEISGHDTGSDWTVVYSPPAVEFQAVIIWLAVWVLVLPCKNNEILRTATQAFWNECSTLTSKVYHTKHSRITVPPWSSKYGV